MQVEQILPYLWRIPKDARRGMRVPGLIYADEALMGTIRQDAALEQVANVAALPGIVKASLAMPDIHWGYGFPVGGVVATDAEDGVVSPGGVGYDINCGVRLLRTDLVAADVRPRMERLIDALAQRSPRAWGRPAGSRSRRRSCGACWPGRAPGGRWRGGTGTPRSSTRWNPTGAARRRSGRRVSEGVRARPEPARHARLGQPLPRSAGRRDRAPADVAAALGLDEGQVTVMIHSGSRGLGYQVCDDALGVMQGAMRRYRITLPDRQLACAPVTSPEGRTYLGAMRAAANFALSNRQCLAHFAREAIERTLGVSPRDLGWRLVYDVAHNIAKVEEHEVDGRRRRLWCTARGPRGRSRPAIPSCRTRTARWASR